MHPTMQTNQCLSLAQFICTYKIGTHGWNWYISRLGKYYEKLNLRKKFHIFKWSNIGLGFFFIKKKKRRGKLKEECENQGVGLGREKRWGPTRSEQKSRGWAWKE